MITDGAKMMVDLASEDDDIGIDATDHVADEYEDTRDDQQRHAAMEERDAEMRTLFLGNLPPDASQREIYLLCRHLPGYSRSVLNAQRGGAPVAFVSFDCHDNAEQAMQELQGAVIDPHMAPHLRLRVDWARENTKRQGRTGSSQKWRNEHDRHLSDNIDDDGPSSSTTTTTTTATATSITSDAAAAVADAADGDDIDSSSVVATATTATTTTTTPATTTADADARRRRSDTRNKQQQQQHSGGSVKRLRTRQDSWPSFSSAFYTHPYMGAYSGSASGDHNSLLYSYYGQQQYRQHRHQSSSMRQLQYSPSLGEGKRFKPSGDGSDLVHRQQQQQQQQLSTFSSSSSSMSPQHTSTSLSAQTPRFAQHFSYLYSYYYFHSKQYAITAITA